jgi:hypothetical protein
MVRKEQQPITTAFAKAGLKEVNKVYNFNKQQ